MSVVGDNDLDLGPEHVEICFYRRGEFTIRRRQEMMSRVDDGELYGTVRVRHRERAILAAHLGKENRAPCVLVWTRTNVNVLNAERLD